MATKTLNETYGCTFQWTIENLRHCFLKIDEPLISPVFIAHVLDGTKWTLTLYPNGLKDKSYMGFYLHRERDCSGPNIIEIHYQFTFQNKDGSLLNSFQRKVSSNRFRRNAGWGYAEFVACEVVFDLKAVSFLPEDILIVQCTIWNKGEMPAKPKLLSARTVFKVNRRSFVWKIDEFSNVKPGVRNKIKDDLMDLDLVFNELVDFVKKLDVDIISFDKSVRYFSLKTSIINSKGEKEVCGVHEYYAHNLNKQLLPTPLFSKMLLKNQKRYLTEDVLLLDCEYVCSNGAVLQENCGSGITVPKVSKPITIKSPEDCIEKEKNHSALMNDLKSLYNDRILNDIELRTTTKSFSAHKVILSARSSVFKTMFSIDMIENKSGYVEITDLEDDTIQRMLLYIYTDTLENLQVESACELYSAADKYQILSLRTKCSSFIKNNLCLTKACDILVLADLHSDDDLKSAVQNYILKHGKKIFGSREWEHLMTTNLKLAANIMYKKVCP